MTGKWDHSKQTWRSGEFAVLPDNKTNETNTETLGSYNTSRWRDKLTIRKSAPNLTDDEDDAQRQKINYGIRLHKAFSGIYFASDVPSVLNKMESEGDINTGEKEMLGSFA